MNNQPPLVSIIMAAYNASSFIADSIESVLKQSHQNWELLVINDGSVDQTELIVLDYQNRNSKIRYFSQTNQGVSSARNVGLSNMAGSYFCFLDADDKLPTDSLKDRLACFTKQDVAFVDGTVQVYNNSFSNLLYTWVPQVAGLVLNNLVRLDGKAFFGPSWLIKRIEGKNYSFSTSLSHGEDLLFCMSIADSGRYAYTNSVVLHYRKSKTSAMSNSIGLANGYTRMLYKLKDLNSNVRFFDLLVFKYRIRRIMFLTFLREGKLKLALRYLCFAKLN